MNIFLLRASTSKPDSGFDCLRENGFDPELLLRLFFTVNKLAIAGKIEMDSFQNLNKKTKDMKKFLKTNLGHLYWAWLILLLISGTVEAQTNDDSANTSRHRKYYARVTLTNGQKVKGVLKLIGDNRIQLLEKKTIGKMRNGVNEVPDTLHYSNIQTIKIRNIGATIGGTVGGIAIGVIIGGVLGYLAPKEENYDYDDNWRIVTGFLGAGAGGVIGGVGGSKLGPPSFEVAGQYQKFQEFRARMKKKGMEVE